MRYTVKDLARASGLCRKTIRKYADAGRLPFTRDLNNWRVFGENAIEKAKKIAGTAEKKV